MPATVNLLGRAAALPTPRGGAGLAALPELGYALFETGEVDEASAVLAGARERARADGDRRVEWLVTITRPRIEMYRDPAGIDLDALAVETETAIGVLGELGDEAGLARAYMVLSDIHWSNGRLSDTSHAATRAADHARRAGNRREVGWALGQNALCAIHGPMPVAEGLDWLERLLRGEPENRTLDANLSGFVTLLAAIDEAPAPDCEWRVKRTGVPARLLARRGRLEEAERLARDGVTIAADSEFVVLHADVLLDLAEVLELAGRPDEASAAAAEAVRIYERKGNVAAAGRARDRAR
jgi:tetratricopeptide (TPR) repeat protein